MLLMDKIDKTFSCSKLVIVISCKIKLTTTTGKYNKKNIFKIILNKNKTFSYSEFDVEIMEDITINQDNFYLTEILDDISTHNATVNNTYDKLFQGYSEGLLNFASTTCIIFILIGVPGNLITIIALARCKKVRNATAVFIINLSLSDLLFCCFNLPLAASTFWRRSWHHGELLCRLFPLMRYGLLAVSLFTILAITINRYVTIGHPRIYPRIYRHRYLGIMVAATWVGAFSALIPTWRGTWGKFGLNRNIGSCTILPDENGISPKELLFVLAFVLPAFCIVVCYARIFYIVRKTALKTHESILSNNSVRVASMRNSTVITKSQKTLAQDNSHHSEKQLIDKTSKIFKEENSENSSTSNSSGIPPIVHMTNQILVIQQPSQFCNSKLERNSSHRDSTRSCRPFLSKMRDEDLKFIDTSVESDFPPSLSALKYREKRDTTPGVESIEEGPELLKPQNSKAIEIDSAIEDSTSSTDNNQVFHITAGSDNQLLSVQVEPSSSSGVDLPLDQEDPPPRKRQFKKTFKTSVTRMTSKKSRKASTTNASAASILYPGKLSQKDRRLLKMILVIFLSFAICYLPITITKIWKNVTKIHVVNIMGYLLIYLTTCINPIIYVVMSSEYRQAYKQLLLCRTVAAARNAAAVNGLAARKDSKLRRYSMPA